LQWCGVLRAVMRACGRTCDDYAVTRHPKKSFRRMTCMERLLALARYVIMTCRLSTLRLFRYMYQYPRHLNATIPRIPSISSGCLLLPVVLVSAVLVSLSTKAVVLAFLRHTPLSHRVAPMVCRAAKMHVKVSDSGLKTGYRLGCSQRTAVQPTSAIVSSHIRPRPSTR